MPNDKESFKSTRPGARSHLDCEAWARLPSFNGQMKVNEGEF